MTQDDQQPGGLVLVSTFSSLPDTAAVHYPWLPVRLLLIERFPSARRIADVDCPILVVHGRRDRIIPFELGERLFDAAPPQSRSGVAKQFVELPQNGHNDIPVRRFHAEFRQFLERVSAAPVPER